MRRAILVAIISLMLMPLYSAVLPYDERAGQIVLVTSSSSPELLAAKKAVESPYSDIWLEEFCDPQAAVLINSMYFKSLTASLPFKNPVFASETPGVVKVRDIDTDNLITFHFSSECRIISLSFSD